MIKPLHIVVFVSVLWWHKDIVVPHLCDIVQGSSLVTITKHMTSL